MSRLSNARGRLEVFALQGADEGTLDDVLKEKAFLAHGAIIDTGPQDQKAQKLALDRAHYVVIVDSPAWGSRNATSVLKTALKKQYSRVPYVVVKNRYDDGKDGDGVIAIPEISDIQKMLLARRSGQAAQYADRIIGDIEERVGSWDGEVCIVSVVGGKGGIGKSTVAALLSIRLAEHGGTACLLDLDCQYGNLSTVVANKSLEQGEHFRWGVA